MRTSTSPPLYRHTSAAVLRAASAPLTAAPTAWPDPSDPGTVRAWLDRVWSDPQTADAVRLASPTLADRIEAARAGGEMSAKQLRRLMLSTARYLLRTTGRPTPFGLFAGAAPVTVTDAARVSFTGGHRGTADVDAQWLADITSCLEAIDELLDRLPVVFTNLAQPRGRHLHMPHGPDRVAIRNTAAVAAARQAAASPVPFHTLAAKLAAQFPATGPATVRTMLAELVRQGFVITSLRAPLTVTDPLDHLIARLREAGADTVPEAAGWLKELQAIHDEVRRHNHTPTTGEQARLRAALTGRMRRGSEAGRTPLGINLRLGREVEIPRRVAHETERAASALLRLTREPTGPAAWREWYTAFCERYGTGTLVPLMHVLHPDAGLGYPAGYPGSVYPQPRPRFTARDEQLAALAWQAMADGSHQVTLTDELIDTLAGDLLDQRYIPPHVEITARIHASSTAALEDGEFTLTVAPGRSAGTFTARFADTAPALADVYARVPTITEGALAAQLSTPPVYPHAQNICRTPLFLRHVIPLGEHRGPETGVEVIELEDLALTATRERLHLVSISRRQVVEPQLFHALAIEKQLAPLARFLTQVSRAGLAAWTEFDWGPHVNMPFLPRVRYRRTILCPARWRLVADDVPLASWRKRWQCPAMVELRQDDRSLRLDLDVPLHAALVHAHLERHGAAVLTETTDSADELGWIGGHAHEIALPLVADGPPAPNPLVGPMPLVTNHGHGQAPASAGARWLNAKIPTHPERIAEIVARHLPALLAELGEETPYWFVRYRSAHETDHLRLRIRTPSSEDAAACAQVVAQWADQMRGEQLAGPLTFDTYHPETGRYGTGKAMEMAEAVFTADSAVVAAQLQYVPASAVDPVALTAWGMVETVRGFLGAEQATQWLAGQPVHAGRPADRTTASEAVRLAHHSTPDSLPCQVAAAWRARAKALAAYAAVLPDGMDTDAVLEALLHMHHNRARGIDRDGEAVCRRLARQAALAWHHHGGGDVR
ncbi:lantibiotic dehydratase [Streptomyces solisilvae]|uniref:lantibiotic dehydratase n=1 Tax=Streptomyces malaysiensis TaxID=92644 RepID=UPI00369F284E